MYLFIAFLAWLWYNWCIKCIILMNFFTNTPAYQNHNQGARVNFTIIVFFNISFKSLWLLLITWEFQCIFIIFIPPLFPLPITYKVDIFASFKALHLHKNICFYNLLCPVHAGNMFMAFYLSLVVFSEVTPLKKPDSSWSRSHQL